MQITCIFYLNTQKAELEAQRKQITMLQKQVAEQQLQLQQQQLLHAQLFNNIIMSQSKQTTPTLQVYVLKFFRSTIHVKTKDSGFFVQFRFGCV